MEDLTVGYDRIIVVSGEDKGIYVYRLWPFESLSIQASPITETELGGTFAGAAILELPWP